jgi:hypothetical protein
MSSFFEYLESIQVVKQTHQISALNSVSFCDFFKDKHQPPLPYDINGYVWWPMSANEKILYEKFIFQF